MIGRRTIRIATLLSALALASSSSVPLFAQTSAENAATTADKNKALVTAFYTRVLFGLDADAAAEYIGPTYVQHNPAKKDGLQPLQDYIRHLKASGAHPAGAIAHVFADGDFVILHVHAKTSADDPGLAVVDIFRVENGKIVEHWDVVQPVPAQTASGRSMF